MTANEIEQYLSELNDELALKDIKGELSLFGGSVMVLAFKARIATKDIDAIFFPSSEIRAAAARIADRHGLNRDWLNDGVKGYVVEHSETVLFHLSNLTVFIPEADYLLAMKALAARADTEDESDVITLIEALEVTSADEVFLIIERYYPKRQIPPRTQYFIEGLFEQ
ncbi:MAG TPA: DUF6036 family nucleotidyltransferase [Pyrinomonadaceae bacterium]|nr:DUF6036 family nucleotidyltransferase [Pyrinomonadaceae bacterium]